MFKLKMSFLSVLLLCGNIIHTELSEKTLYQKTCNFLKTNKNAIIASIVSTATTAVGFCYWYHYRIFPSCITKIKELEEIKNPKNSSGIVTSPVLEKKSLRFYNHLKDVLKKEQVSMSEIITLATEGLDDPMFRSFVKGLRKKKDFKEQIDFFFEYVSKLPPFFTDPIKQQLIENDIKIPEYKGSYSNIKDVILIKDDLDVLDQGLIAQLEKIEKYDLKDVILELLDKNSKKHVISKKHVTSKETHPLILIDIKQFVALYFMKRLFEALKITPVK